MPIDDLPAYQATPNISDLPPPPKQAVNSTPFQLPKVAAANVVGGGDPASRMIQGITGQRPWSPDEQQMANSGMDITSGLPYGLRNEIGLMTSPTDDDRKNAINKWFGKDVGVRKNDQGRLEYINPKTNRRTLVDPIGAPDLPTAPGVAEGALQMAGAGIGGAVGMGAGAPGVMAGGAAGAAVGTGLADVGKRLIGKYFGVEQKGSEWESAVGKDAGQAAIMSLAGDVAVRGGPELVNFLKRGGWGQKLTYSDAKMLLDAAKEGQDKLEPYFKLVGNNAQFQTNLSIPELIALNPQLPATHENLEQMYKGSWAHLPSLTNIEQNRVNRNLTALQSSFENLNNMYRPSEDYQFGNFGANLKLTLAQKAQQSSNEIELEKMYYAENLKRKAEGLPEISADDMNKQISTWFETRKQAGYDKMNQAYTNLKVLLGEPPSIALQNSDKWLQVRDQPGATWSGQREFVPLYPEAQQKLKNYYFRAVQAGMTPYEGGAATNPNLGEAMANAIPEGMRQPLGKDEMSPFGWKLKLDGSYDALDMINAIQNLRSGLRAQMNAKGTLVPSGQNMKDIENILESNIRQHFQEKGDPRILNAWEEAQQAAKDYSRQFRDSILGQISTNKSTGFDNPVYNQWVSSVLLGAGKGKDQQAIKELGGILNADPEAKNDAANMLWAMFKNNSKYMPADGIVRPQNVQAFKDDFEGPIKQLFSQSDYDKLSSFEDVAKLFRDTSQQYKTFRKDWSASFQGQFGRPSSSTLSNAAFTPTIDNVKFQQMSYWLKSQQPELFKELQADTATTFARKVSDANGVPDPVLIQNALSKYGNRLTAVLGPDYVSNATALANAATAVTKGAVKNQLAPEEQKSILQQVVRWLYAPPLSAEGRQYTSYLMVMKRAAARTTYNALSNPLELSKFIARRDMGVRSMIGANMLGELGGQTLATNQDVVQ